jgi:hypothetical protein
MSTIEPSTSTPTAESPPAPQRAYQAYLDTLEERRAVPTANLLQVNLDIPAIYAIGMGASPKIKAFRDQLATLPEINVASLDKLPTYALALFQANGMHLAASTPKESLPALYERGYQRREQMILDLTPLAARGIIDGEPLKTLKGTNGYMNLASDLMTLSSLARNDWDKINGKCSLEFSEIEEAADLGQRIGASVGIRDQSAPAVTEAADIRERAFTLFVNAYDQARRGLSFLRWNEGDVDQIAPSLYGGRNTGRRKTDPNAPSPSPAPAAEPGASTAAPAAPAVRVGMPGASPLVQ